MLDSRLAHAAGSTRFEVERAVAPPAGHRVAEVGGQRFQPLGDSDLRAAAVMARGGDQHAAVVAQPWELDAVDRPPPAWALEGDARRREVDEAGHARIVTAAPVAEFLLQVAEILPRAAEHAPQRRRAQLKLAA
jgi:hypothetical protein